MTSDRISEAMVEAAKAAFDKAEHNPVMILCERCKGSGSHHGFGENGADPDWCDECGGGGFALAPGEELRPLREALTAALSVPAPDTGGAEELQERVQPWMMACFGAEISGDKVERGDRLLEEVFELLQSGGYDPARVIALRDYVWGREAGEPFQEVGGVMITMDGLSEWAGWDQARHPWGETKHKDAVLEALFRGAWSVEDAAALLGFIDRTWTKRPSPQGGR